MSGRVLKRGARIADSEVDGCRQAHPPFGKSMEALIVLLILA